jgi:hypothetical protein
MSGLGTVTKVLAAVQDLALGLGTVSQTRQGQAVTVDKICLPFIFGNIAAIKAADYEKFPLVKLLGNSITEYYYDSASEATADDDLVLLPSSGVGRWLKLSAGDNGISLLPGGLVQVSTNWNAITETGFYTNGSTATFTGSPEQGTENLCCIHLKLSGEEDEVGTYYQIAISPINKVYNRAVIGGDTGWLPNNSAHISLQTGGTYSLTLYDVDRYIRFTAECTITVPVISNLLQGSEIHGRNAGVSNLTINPSGTTVNVPTEGGFTIPPGGTFTLKYVDTNTWDLFGITLPSEGGGIS